MPQMGSGVSHATDLCVDPAGVDFPKNRRAALDDGLELRGGRFGVSAQHARGSC